MCVRVCLALDRERTSGEMRTFTLSHHCAHKTGLPLPLLPRSFSLLRLLSHQDFDPMACMCVQHGSSFDLARDIERKSPAVERRLLVRTEREGQRRE